MTREEKDLVLQDLCARLPYSPICHIIGENGADIDDILTTSTIQNLDVWVVKPYLRPLSSMTEEETREIAILHGYNPVEILSTKVTDEYIDIILDNCNSCTITSTIWYDGIISSLECFDYLNKKMFDFRGLIPKDLALSTEIYNPYKD